MGRGRAGVAERQRRWTALGNKQKMNEGMEKRQTLEGFACGGDGDVMVGRRGGGERKETAKGGGRGRRWERGS